MIESTVNYQVETQSADETKIAAAELLEKLLSSTEEESGKCLVFLLSGDLGAGKTHFAKGLGEALHLPKIKSPSYIYVNEHDVHSLLYPRVKKLIHIDAWRIEDEATASLIIIPAYFQPHNIVIIEWPEKLTQITKLIPSEANKISVKFKLLGENLRQLSIQKI